MAGHIPEDPPVPEDSTRLDDLDAEVRGMRQQLRDITHLLQPQRKPNPTPSTEAATPLPAPATGSGFSAAEFIKALNESRTEGYDAGAKLARVENEQLRSEVSTLNETVGEMLDVIENLNSDTLADREQDTVKRGKERVGMYLSEKLNENADKIEESMDKMLPNMGRKFLEVLYSALGIEMPKRIDDAAQNSEA